MRVLAIEACKKLGIYQLEEFQTFEIKLSKIDKELNKIIAQAEQYKNH